MAFDFSLSERVEQWRDRIKGFVDEVVIPREQDAFAHGGDDTLRKELQQEAKAAGLWAPQAPAELGGGGFAFDEAAVLLEEAGRSLLGPLALNCSAPDEGNIGLLHMIGTRSQQQRYLLPLVAGDVRSCFAMTEPPPGAGSDPSALRTSAATARRSAGTAGSGSPTPSCPTTRCLASRARGSGTRRSGWRRPGSRTACAGSARPGGRTRSRWPAA